VRAVRFAEGVTARDQRDGLFVVHRHASECECFANILGHQERGRLAVRAWLPAGAEAPLSADRFYPSVDLFAWSHARPG